MTERCLRPKDLDDLIDGYAMPDWQDHLQSCAACRALLAEYSSFLAAEPTAGADPLAAEEALDHMLPPPLRCPGEQTSGTRDSSRWSVFLNGPRWRPVLATAALAAVLMIVLWPQGQERFTDPSGLVRGQDSLERGFSLEIQDVNADGNWVVGWPSLAQATGYRIEVLDQAMSVVRSWTEGQVTGFELDPAGLPAGSDGPWFVRVLALEDTRELARTPLRELPAGP